MQATVAAQRPRVSAVLMASAILGALCLGGASGYLLRGLEAQSSSGLTAPTGGSSNARLFIDQVTGYPSGSRDDQRILAILEQSGYEGGATVARSGPPDGQTQ
jgi:hypothetical protein